MNFNEEGVVISWEEGRYLAGKLYSVVRRDLKNNELLSENLEDVFDWIEAIQEIQNNYYTNIGILTNLSVFSESFETFLKSLRE